MPAINSHAYWEDRFAEQWEARFGREQTRFFGDLAVALWPAWLRKQVQERGLGICDWGCALGDATAVLARGLGATVLGVDFSAQAVARARELHPEHEFRCEDWLVGGASDSHDVVFSSNTLEHFETPWSVFARLAAQARRHVVLLLPYAEPAHARIDEHRVSFDASNLPLAPLPEWFLADLQLAELGPSPFWSGQQVLLVYSRGSELAEIGLTEGRCCACRVDPARDARALEQAAVQEALRQRDAHAAAIELLLRENQALRESQQCVPPLK